MNGLLSRASWSERRQVLAIIVGAGAIVGAVSYFALLPLTQQRRAIDRENRSIRSKLAASNYLVGEEPLRLELQRASSHNASLHKQWDGFARRLSAFHDTVDVTEGEVPRIDFKVRLSEVRKRLLVKSSDYSITLPVNLGLDEAVYSDEDARKLMFQLLAVEKLVDLTLDLRIRMIEDINPMPPVPHTAGESQTVFLEEYPVAFTFQGSVENLYELFRAVREEGGVFVFKHLSVEKASMTQADLVKVRTVMSALLFTRPPKAVADEDARSRPQRQLPRGI